MSKYCRKIGATVRFFSRDAKKTWIAIYALFFSSIAVGTILLVLLPTPSFLADMYPSANRGLALSVWSIATLVFGVSSGLLVDGLGYKRVLAFGLIMALFGSVLQTGAVALYPNPVVSSLFWITSIVTAAALSAVTLSSMSAVASFAGQRVGRKFGMAIATSASHFGVALAGLLHAPFIKDAIAREMTTDVPVVVHVGLVVVLLAGVVAISFGVLAIPFIKKDRLLGADGQSVGLLASLRPLRTSSFWRLAAFGFMLVGAKSSLYYGLYLTPHYISATTGINVDAGIATAILFGITGLLSPVVQLLITNMNPIIVIPFGAVLGSFGLFCMLLGHSTIIGYWGVGGAVLVVALGDAVWWPRFLAYAADVAGDELHTGLFVGLARATDSYAMILAALVSAAMIESQCVAETLCTGVWIWIIPGSIAIGQTAIGIFLIRLTFSPDIRSNWSKELLNLPTEEELKKLSVALDSSSSSSSSQNANIKMSTPRRELTVYSTRSGVSLRPMDEDETDDGIGNPF